MGILWAASGGFSAAIEALNIAYNMEETRPFWKTRPLSIGLTLLIGFLLLIALGVMIVGHVMVWLYWTGFAMLIGAELNAELAKRSEAGAIEREEEPKPEAKLGLTAQRIENEHFAN